MDENAQNRACTRIFSSVILQAIRDACLPPVNRESKMKLEEFGGKCQSEVALDAMEFLFGENKTFDLYMTLLDMHPDHFRSKLLDAMEGEGNTGYFNVTIDASQRRAFRWNHLQHVKTMANRSEVLKNFQKVKILPKKEAVVIPVFTELNQLSLPI
jgi:hypothetical protein